MRHEPIDPKILNTIINKFPVTPTDVLCDHIETVHNVRLQPYTVRWHYYKSLGTDSRSKKKLLTKVNEEGVRTQDGMFNLTDLAKHLGLTRNKLHNILRKLELPSYDFGHGVYVDRQTRASLEAFIQVMSEHYFLPDLARAAKLNYADVYLAVKENAVPLLRYGKRVIVALPKKDAVDLVTRLVKNKQAELAKKQG